MTSAARRFRLILIPVVLIVLGLTFHPWSGEEGLGGVRVSSAWNLMPSAPDQKQVMWSYVEAEGDAEDVADQTWEWVRSKSFQEAHGYRRPSWGGLKAQGAKKHLTDNLRDDQRYFMTYPTAGWNNQVMEVMTGIQIAIQSNRIPVVAPFFGYDSHLGGRAGAVPTGDIFDLSRLAMYWEKPIVEAYELKVSSDYLDHSRVVKYDGEHTMDIPVGSMIRAEEPESEALTCWSTHLLWAGGSAPRGVFKPLQQAFVPVPVNLTHSRVDREHCNTGMTSDFMKHPTIHPETQARLDELKQPLPEVLPSDKFACIDSVYWCHNAGRGLHEDWHKGEGAWLNVGIHMRWQPGLVQLADDFLRNIFDLRPNAPIPQYMAIHIRRGDFNEYWKKVKPAQYAYKAYETMTEAATMGLKPEKVIVTTDETDPEWLDQLRAYGFIVVDHAAAQTGEKLGWWMPTLLDAIMLSKAHVFLGNPSSTMSILAKRRVIDWNMGYTKNMNAGTKVPEGWQWTMPA